MDYVSSSQVLFSHCALIPLQKFYPSSCEISFYSGNKNIDFRYASLFLFGKKGFAIGYRKLLNGGNIVSTAYGLKQENFNFGAGFNIFFNKGAPYLLVNVSSAAELHEKNRIVVSGINIGNLSKESIYPEVKIENAGYLFKKKNIVYNAEVNHVFNDAVFLGQSSGMSFYLKSKLYDQPGFFYSLGYELQYEKMTNIHHIAGTGLGVVASFSEKATGLYFGYSYDFFSKESKIQCKLHYNPFEYTDIMAPNPIVNVSCGSGTKTGFFVSVQCTDNEGGSGIKSWTLVFTDKPGKNGNIYKVFSGGNIVPSTVYWDLRDKTGNVLDTVSFYTRIVVIDNKKNAGYSPWIFLKPCR
jgi:hypothetical protein